MSTYQGFYVANKAVFILSAFTFKCIGYKYYLDVLLACLIDEFMHVKHHGNNIYERAPRKILLPFLPPYLKSVQCSEFRVLNLPKQEIN